MQSIPFSKFKQLKAGDLKELKSFKVTSDGELLCYIIVPRGETIIQGALNSQVEDIIMRYHVVGGKECTLLDGVLQS